MKKVKYRNNNNYNNQVYSINYKFDSISPAGKCSGTALDLIKKYNELAKEAQGNGNYVEAEVFRQYAEHYRKIITDINERKNIRFGNKDNEQQANAAAANTAEESTNNNMSTKEEVAEAEPEPKTQEESSLVETKPKTAKKSFTVIDASKEAAKPVKATRTRIKKDIKPSSVNE